MEPTNKMLSIHLTDLCNNRCIFCVVDSPFQKKEQVLREKIDQFLEDHQGKGYSAVNIHGGEATTRKDFIEILEKIKKCNYPRVILQTNARKLADMDYARRIFELGVDLFVVSIHGEGEIHDQITRVSGSFSQAVQGIKNVKELGAKVRTNSVVSKLNFRQLPDTIRFILSLKADHINISALHTAGTAFRNFEVVTPAYREIKPVVKEIVSIVSGAGVKITLEGFPFCSIPGLEQYVIDWGSQKFKMFFRTFILEDYENYMDRAMRIQGEPCRLCHQNKKCGGVYKEYISIRGWDEFGYSPLNEEKDLYASI